MAAHRRPAPRGAEVRLGGDGVLVVAEVVAGVGEQLDEATSEVRRVALAPVRHDDGEAVEHQAPEARVVLGEVVDLRAAASSGSSQLVVGGAVELARAVDLEREGDLGEDRVEARPAAVGCERCDATRRSM